MGLQKVLLGTTIKWGKKEIQKSLPAPKTVKGLLEYKPLAAQASHKYGKHKIPRYIYHMTNKENYESMLKDGVIKTSKDKLIGRGVFATELTNLFKRWGRNSIWEGASLQNELIKQASKGNGEIVILKIPTEKLNQDLLKIRSQNTLFKWYFSGRNMDILDNAEREFKRTSQGKNGWIDKFINLLRNKFTKNETIDSVIHLTEGAPAKDSHLYKQRKQALEYVYKEDIPITNVEKIGEVNIRQLRKSEEYDPLRPMRSIFIALLKGQPEVKGAELLKC